MTTAYFDTCIQSGRLFTDLKAAEMNAVRVLERAEREGKIKIVTSRQTHWEHEGTNDLTKRAQLVQSHADTPLVPKDHTSRTSQSNGSLGDRLCDPYAYRNCRWAVVR
jgi:hypothetical protein